MGESSEIPVTYYHNNVTATIYLLQIMSEFDCSRIVYSSSATVYGDPPNVPIPETTRLKADSPYGRSKVMCESVIEDLAHGASFCIFLLWHRSLNEFPQRNLSAGAPSPYGTSIPQVRTRPV